MGRVQIRYQHTLRVQCPRELTGQFDLVKPRKMGRDIEARNDLGRLETRTRNDVFIDGIRMPMDAAAKVFGNFDPEVCGWFRLDTREMADVLDLLTQILFN